jgi:hypothetical protein
VLRKTVKENIFLIIKEKEKRKKYVFTICGTLSSDTLSDFIGFWEKKKGDMFFVLFYSLFSLWFFFFIYTSWYTIPNKALKCILISLYKIIKATDKATGAVVFFSTVLLFTYYTIWALIMVTAHFHH